MDMKTIETTHPALFEALYLIAADSGLPREHWQMDDRWQPELTELERQAQLLKALPSTDETFEDVTEFMGYPVTALHDYAVGEFHAHRALMETHAVVRLGWFLNTFFGECDYCEPGTEFQS